MMKKPRIMVLKYEPTSHPEAFGRADRLAVDLLKLGTKVGASVGYAAAWLVLKLGR